MGSFYIKCSNKELHKEIQAIAIKSDLSENKVVDMALAYYTLHRSLVNQQENSKIVIDDLKQSAIEAKAAGDNQKFEDLIAAMNSLIFEQFRYLMPELTTHYFEALNEVHGVK